MIHQIICIRCPRGCNLEVDDSKLEVRGNFCPNGKEYGLSEVTCPKRTLTSSVKVLSGTIARVSIKSASPIEKGKIADVMKEINRIEVKAPIQMHQVLIENVLNTGVDIIATKEVLKKDE